MNNEPYIHPVHQVNDGIITSYRKQKIDFLNPNPEMICIDDICKGLSNACRYAGQIDDHYSVAQHSILVMLLAPHELRLAALLHDAAEAYLGDIVKPVKNLIQGFDKLEHAMEKVIFEKFNVDLKCLSSVKPFDLQALQIEYDYLHYGGDAFALIFKGLVAKRVDKSSTYAIKDEYEAFWSAKDACEYYKMMLDEAIGRGGE